MPTSLLAISLFIAVQTSAPPPAVPRLDARAAQAIVAGCVAH